VLGLRDDAELYVLGGKSFELLDKLCANHVFPSIGLV
jgi:hypothetical protein